MLIAFSVSLVPLVLLLIAIFGPMVVEAAIARRHERIQMARGGIEPVGDVYAAMRWLYPGLFLTMIAEGALRGGPTLGWFVMGAAIFGLAKTLKWWAIRSLGTFWTFRVIVVPGVLLVRAGPYRYLRHPNYVAVIGEFIGAALMARSWIAGPLAIALFGALILKRIAVEEHALDRRTRA